MSATPPSGRRDEENPYAYYPHEEDAPEPPPPSGPSTPDVGEDLITQAVKTVIVLTLTALAVILIATTA